MTAQIPISKISLYDRDFQLWIETTVNQLRQEDFDSVDWTNLIEELASMGKNNRHALKSLLIQLLAHLLNLAASHICRNIDKQRLSVTLRLLQIYQLLPVSIPPKN